MERSNSTDTKWIHAAQMSDDFREIFYHMPNIGRKSQDLFDGILTFILEHLGDAIETASSIRMVIDDTPTKRYGKKIEGAGWHHNPTPGKTDAKLCFGHQQHRSTRQWVVDLAT